MLGESNPTPSSSRGGLVKTIALPTDSGSASRSSSSDAESMGRNIFSNSATPALGGNLIAAARKAKLRAGTAICHVSIHIASLRMWS